MKNVIIIPTYNERENITDLVKEIFLQMPEVYVLIVDDHSPDGTAQAVRELQKSFSQLHLIERDQKDGLGGAYIRGFQEVLKDSRVGKIITMDADFSHAPRYIPKLLELSRDAELVIGSRYVAGGGIQKWEIWRRFLSRIGNFYVRCILGLTVHDWTSGFTCIDTQLLRTVQLGQIDLSGYAFLQELKYLLLRAGARVREYPIIFEARRNGESKISAFIIREGIIGPWKIRNRK